MTYSIVALDRNNGELGVAVQSHYFQVGPSVPWAAAGVGAVATQSMVNVSFGPLGLDYLRLGYTAEQTLNALIAGDSEPERRQVAIVDARGNVAVHTGSKCIPAAGHRAGDAFSVQANLMEKDTVWDAMAHTFTSTEGQLAERMMAALDAAEAEGGDIRGKQSAAMLVVTGHPTGRPWEDRIIDLRVEDSPEPLIELRRLLNIRRSLLGHQAANKVAEAGDKRAAAEMHLKALSIAPELVEMRFWTGLNLVEAGEHDQGWRLVVEAVNTDPRWIETLRRLVTVGRFSADLAAQIETRLAVNPQRL